MGLGLNQFLKLDHGVLWISGGEGLVWGGGLVWIRGLWIVGVLCCCETLDWWWWWLWRIGLGWWGFGFVGLLWCCEAPDHWWWWLQRIYLGWWVMYLWVFWSLDWWLCWLCCCAGYNCYYLFSFFQMQIIYATMQWTYSSPPSSFLFYFLIETSVIIQLKLEWKTARS